MKNTAKDKIGKPKRSPLDRAIAGRERGIARMERDIKEVERLAQEDVAAIKKRMAQKKFLLDALKRGQIQP